MTERTIGQKVHQWITNLTILIPVIAALTGGALYGNSETVKDFVHGKPSPKPVIIEKENYDLIINQLIENDKRQVNATEKHRIRLGKLERWH